VRAVWWWREESSSNMDEMVEIYIRRKVRLKSCTKAERAWTLYIRIHMERYIYISSKLKNCWKTDSQIFQHIWGLLVDISRKEGNMTGKERERGLQRYYVMLRMLSFLSCFMSAQFEGRVFMDIGIGIEAY